MIQTKTSFSLLGLVADTPNTVRLHPRERFSWCSCYACGVYKRRWAESMGMGQHGPMPYVVPADVLELEDSDVD